MPPPPPPLSAVVSVKKEKPIPVQEPVVVETAVDTEPEIIVKPSKPTTTVIRKKKTKQYITVKEVAAWTPTFEVMQRLSLPLAIFKEIFEMDFPSIDDYQIGDVIVRVQLDGDVVELKLGKELINDNYSNINAGPMIQNSNGLWELLLQHGFELKETRNYNSFQGSIYHGRLMAERVFERCI